MPEHLDLGVQDQQASEGGADDNGMGRIAAAAAELDGVAQGGRPAIAGGTLHPGEQVGPTKVVAMRIAAVTIGVGGEWERSGDEIGNSIGEWDSKLTVGAAQQIEGNRAQTAPAMRAVHLVGQFHRTAVPTVQTALALSAGEARLALFLVGTNTLLKVVRLADLGDGLAHRHHTLDRADRHDFIYQPFQCADHQRRGFEKLSAISSASVSCWPFGTTRLTKPTS